MMKRINYLKGFIYQNAMWVTISLMFVMITVGFTLPGRLLQVKNLDLWHTHGVIVQTTALLLFCLMFAIPQKRKSQVNNALFYLLLWLGAVTAYYCFMTQGTKGAYEVAKFFPYFNIICMVFIYKAITEYCDERDLMLIGRVMRWTIIINMLLAVLQYFGFSQFFYALFPDDKWRNNVAVGVIGNGTHFAGFLAMCSPLFFSKKREDILCMTLLAIILFTITGTRIGDPAASGVVVLGAVIAYYIFNVKKLWFWVIASLLVAGIVFAYQYNILYGKLDDFLDLQGKQTLFQFYFFKVAKKQFITGWGLGFINTIYRFTGVLSDNRHAHNEYLQLLVETGVVGLIFAIGFIQDFLRRQVTKNGLIYKTIFLGYLISLLMNYPGHIWAINIYAVVAYSAAILEKGETRQRRTNLTT